MFICLFIVFSFIYFLFVLFYVCVHECITETTNTKIIFAETIINVLIYAKKNHNKRKNNNKIHTKKFSITQTHTHTLALTQTNSTINDFFSIYGVFFLLFFLCILFLQFFFNGEISECKNKTHTRIHRKKKNVALKQKQKNHHINRETPTIWHATDLIVFLLYLYIFFYFLPSPRSLWSFFYGCGQPYSVSQSTSRLRVLLEMKTTKTNRKEKNNHKYFYSSYFYDTFLLFGLFIFPTFIFCL